MTGVITDACIRCKYMDCVEVCPVDAFYEGETMLVINPRECVDCGCCIEECPVDAIVFDTEERAQPWLALNAKYANLWPNVTFDGGQTPPDADHYASVPDKFDQHFSPNPGKGDIGPRTASARAKACCGCAKETPLKKLARLIRSLWR
jgi:ferredoxin